MFWNSHFEKENRREFKWGWFLVLGIILLVVGIIAAFTLPFATEAVAIYIGIMMLVGGIVQIIHAFGVKSWGRFFYWLLAGILYTFGGIVCLVQPVLAAAVFTFLLGFLLVVAGVIRVVIGFGLPIRYGFWDCSCRLI